MIKRIKGLCKKYGFTIMELMVVLGIFTLIMGASFTLVSTGRLSVALGEAQIQAEESARQALNRLAKELRLSNINHLYFYKADMTTEGTGNPVFGPVVFFQIPVGSYGEDMDLETDYSLKWGDETVKNNYIYYHLDATTGQLLKGNSTDRGISTPGTTVIASNISSITFRRVTGFSDLISVVIEGRGESGKEVNTCSLSSTVKLRN